jgi:AraC-like DNA-binding protein
VPAAPRVEGSSSWSCRRSTSSTSSDRCSAAGFGSVDLMRRAFVRLLGITPRRYRELAATSTAG